MYETANFSGMKNLVAGWELFDLEKDPQEMKNIYGRRGTEKITSELKTKLNDLIRQYEDTDAEKIVARGLNK